MSDPIPESQSYQNSETAPKTVTQCDPHETQAESNRDPSTSSIDIPGYQFLEVLGRGGMGIVYKARQVSLNRIVALKMILSGAHAGEQEIDRFRSETETVARLQHPNIVQIHEVGEHEGRLFCALEYVDGGTLAQRLGGTISKPQVAAAMVEVLARAMQAAHDANIVHRDLKPGNVLLSSRGMLKIADFGLAKQLDEEAARTQTGQVLGTPSYMAPEQATGQTRTIGPPADIYALGAILYEMLTGRPPFRETNVLETLIAVRTREPVPPSRLQPALPCDIETICLKCLQKSPSRRYVSASALADDLRRFLNGEPIQARPISPLERSWKWAKRRPVLASLMGVLSVALVALSVLFLVILRTSKDLENRTQEKEGETKRADDEAAKKIDKVIRLNIGHGERHLSAGDTYESFSWFLAGYHEERKHGTPEDSPAMELHRIRLGMVMRQCPRPLHVWRHEKPISQAMYDKKGERVLSYTEEEAVVWDVRTGDPVGPPCTIKPLSGAALSPDGQLIAVKMPLNEEPVRIALLDPASGKVVRDWTVTPPGGPFSRSSFYGSSFVFSPDGSRLLMRHENAVFLWDVATGKAVFPVIKESNTLRSARFNSDGTRLLTVEMGKSAVLWNAKTGEKIRSFDSDTTIQDAFLSPSEKHLIIRKDGSAVIRLVETGTTLAQITQNSGFTLHQVALSPDEQTLVTAMGSSLRGAISEIRMWQMPKGPSLLGTFRTPHATSILTPFTVKGPVYELLFSPEGSTLTTVAEDGTVQIRELAHPLELNARKPHVPPIRLDVQVSNLLELRQVAFNEDGRRLLTWNRHEVRVWDLAHGVSRSCRLQDVIDTDQSRFSADGSKFVALHKGPTYDKDRLSVFDTATGAAIRSVPYQRDIYKLNLIISPDGFRAAVWEGNQFADKPEKGNITLWDFRSTKPTPLEIPIIGMVKRVEFNRAGTVLSIWMNEDTVTVWDALTGKSISPPEGFKGTLFTLHPDGSTGACTDSKDRSHVRLVNCRDGSSVIDSLAHEKKVTWIKYSEDGSRIVVTTETEAYIWEVASGKKIAGPLTHAARIAFLQLSPDGKTLATISGESEDSVEIRLWDIEQGKSVCSPIRVAKEKLHTLLFRADGRLLLYGGNDGAWGLLDPATGEAVSPRIQTPWQNILTHATFVDPGCVFSFGPQGHEVLAVRAIYPNLLQAWDVTPLNGEVGTLDAVASVLAGQRVESDGKVAAIPPESRYQDWLSLRKELPTAWLTSAEEEATWRGRALLTAENYERREVALRHLDALIALRPEDLDLRIRRLQNWQVLRRWDPALAEVAQLLKRFPREPRLWEQRGEVQIRMNNWMEGAVSFGEAIKLAPGRRECWEGHVNALLQGSGAKAAQEAIARAWKDLREDGKPTKEAIRLALLLPNSVDPVTILREAEQLCREKKGYEQTHLLGMAHYRAGRLEEAAELLSGSLKKSDSYYKPRAVLYLCMTRHRQGKTEEAKTLLLEGQRLIEELRKYPLVNNNPFSMPWPLRVELLHLKKQADTILGRQ